MILLICKDDSIVFRFVGWFILIFYLLLGKAVNSKASLFQECNSTQSGKGCSFLACPSGSLCSARICNGLRANLTCPRGYGLQFLGASWGRQDLNACLDTKSSIMNLCIPEPNQLIVQRNWISRMCSNESICEIHASQTDYKDLCGTELLLRSSNCIQSEMYVMLNYTCEPSTGNYEYYPTWTPWSEVKCQAGEQYRYRDCQDPPSKFCTRQSCTAKELTREEQRIPCGVSSTALSLSSIIWNEVYWSSRSYLSGASAFHSSAFKTAQTDIQEFTTLGTTLQQLFTTKSFSKRFTSTVQSNQQSLKGSISQLITKTKSIAESVKKASAWTSSLYSKPDVVATSSHVAKQEGNVTYSSWSLSTMELTKPEYTRTQHLAPSYTQARYNETSHANFSMILTTIHSTPELEIMKNTSLSSPLTTMSINVSHVYTTLKLELTTNASVSLPFSVISIKNPSLATEEVRNSSILATHSRHTIGFSEKLSITLQTSRSNSSITKTSVGFRNATEHIPTRQTLVPSSLPGTSHQGLARSTTYIMKGELKSSEPADSVTRVLSSTSPMTPLIITTETMSIYTESSTTMGTSLASVTTGLPSSSTYSFERLSPTTTHLPISSVTKPGKPTISEAYGRVTLKLSEAEFKKNQGEFVENLCRLVSLELNTTYLAEQCVVLRTEPQGRLKTVVEFVVTDRHMKVDVPTTEKAVEILNRLKDKNRTRELGNVFEGKVLITIMVKPPLPEEKQDWPLWLIILVAVVCLVTVMCITCGLCMYSLHQKRVKRKHSYRIREIEGDTTKKPHKYSVCRGYEYYPNTRCGKSNEALEMDSRPSPKNNTHENVLNIQTKQH